MKNIPNMFTVIPHYKCFYSCIYFIAMPSYVCEEKLIAKGVPPEFHELYCPDPQLKENLMVELTRIDDSYTNRLRDLDRTSDRQ